MDKNSYFKAIRPLLRKLDIDEESVTEVTFRQNGYTIRYFEEPADDAPAGSTPIARVKDGVYEEKKAKKSRSRRPVREDAGNTVVAPGGQVLPVGDRDVDVERDIDTPDGSVVNGDNVNGGEEYDTV